MLISQVSFQRCVRLCNSSSSGWHLSFFSGLFIFCTITLLINWSTSELNGQLNPTTCLGDTDCWIQQSVSPKQVVGFSCPFNSEVDQLISKVIVQKMKSPEKNDKCHPEEDELHSRTQRWKLTWEINILSC